MEKRKSTSPAAVGALIIGAVLAVVFAGWSIKRALSPPPPVTTLAAGGTTVQPGVPAGTTTAAGGQVSVRPTPSGEAGLALGADPFVPLPAPGPNPLLTARGVPALPAPGGMARTAIMGTAGWRGSPGPLPPIVPLGAPSVLPPPGATVAAHPIAVIPSVPAGPPEPEPTLIGTLTGERASAVFKTEQRLVVVPISGSFGSWKVLSVGHGSALVKSGNRTVNLVVGGNRGAGVAQTEEAPASSAPAPTGPSLAPEAPKPAPETPRRRPTRRPIVEGGPSLQVVAANSDPLPDNPVSGRAPMHAAGLRAAPPTAPLVQTVATALPAPEPTDPAPGRAPMHAAGPRVVPPAAPLVQTVATALPAPEPTDPAPRHAPMHEMGPVALPPQLSMPVAEQEPDPKRPDAPPSDQVVDITED